MLVTDLDRDVDTGAQDLGQFLLQCCRHRIVAVFHGRLGFGEECERPPGTLLVDRHLAPGLSLRLAHVHGLGVDDNFPEGAVRSSIIAPAHKRGGLSGPPLNAVQFRQRKFPEANFVLPARPRLVSHQRVRVCDSELRRIECGIDGQRRPVVLDRLIEPSRHAQNFRVGILRVRVFGQGRDVLVHQRK